MIAAMNQIETITFFVADLDLARSFYGRVFPGTVVYEDEVSWVVRIDGVMINLLQSSEAPQLVDPVRIGQPGSGPRLLLTVRVDSVDATCKALRKHGVELLNGPVDRPWGRRTAAFADPDGNVWEIAQEL